MDKKEIIRRLKRMSEHAVYMPGRPPFIMSLDDGVAADEAAILLEEQEAKEQCLKTKCIICPHCDNCDVDENGLLKEQEAVKPITDNEGGYWCGSCHEDMVWHQKYCSNCGRKVKWE